MRLLRLTLARAILGVIPATIWVSSYIKPVRYIVRGFVNRALQLMVR